MDYTPTLPFESKLYPGVVIHLKKLNELRRSELQRLTAELSEKEQVLVDAFRQIYIDHAVEEKNEDGSVKMNPETAEPLRIFESEEHKREAAKRYSALETFRMIEWYPVYIQWGVAEIEGLTIKGRPATAKDLISHDAPDGLMGEVAEELRSRVDLSELDKKK